jgi:hypothetical protein
MNVRELAEWLLAFHDQEATVEVLHCVSGSGYYQQGGVTHSAEFDAEKHVEYTDFRGNPHVKDGESWKDTRTLLLGRNDG